MKEEDIRKLKMFTMKPPMLATFRDVRIRRAEAVLEPDKKMRKMLNEWADSLERELFVDKFL